MSSFAALRPRHAIDRPASGATFDERLVAEISHDLRTPLTSAQLMVHALRDGLVDDGARETYLEQVEQQIGFLGALVDELHALARKATGSEVGDECLHPGELVKATVEMMRIQAEARGIDLRAEVSHCLPVIRGQRIQLQRVLLNLIENATRHARNGGRVVVRAEPVPGGVELEVEDDGRGIAEAEREHVFSRFYSLDPPGSAGRSGLGLAIARAIVEAHRGDIWVADSAAGTRVRLSLPARKPQRPRITAELALNS